MNNTTTETNAAERMTIKVKLATVQSYSRQLPMGATDDLVRRIMAKPEVKAVWLEMDLKNLASVRACVAKLHRMTY
jgi:hypothetical protein